MNERPRVMIYNPPGIHPPFGYSHVAEVRAGKLIYIAGQVGLDATGTLAGSDFATQTRAVFANLSVALEAAGATFHDVAKLNYYCADSVDLSIEMPNLRAIRDSYVNAAAPPPSTLVVVRRLARPEFLIEIEAVAAVAD